MFHHETHAVNEGEDDVIPHWADGIREARKDWNTSRWSDVFSCITVGLYSRAVKMHREIKPQINAKLYHLMDQSKNVFRDQTWVPC